MELLTAILLGLGLVIVSFLWRIKAPSPDKTIPYPETSPFIGNYRQLKENWETAQDWMLDMLLKHDFQSVNFTVPRLGTFAGHGRGVVLSTPEAVKHVLKDQFESYEKSEPVNSMLEEFLGDGIFTSDGAKWKFHRKVASNMFSRRLLRNSSEVALAQALKLKEHLHSHVASGQSVDIQQAFYAYTMDTFAFIAFGVELNSQATAHSFANAFDTIQKCSQDRIANPLWKLCRTFQLTEDERTISRCRKELDTFCTWVIDQKRRMLEDQDGAELGPDLLSRFLSTDKSISNKELRDIVMNFIIAGRDTTAATLSWGMFELLKHPEVKAKLTAEIEEKQSTEGDLTTLGPDRLFQIIEHELPYTKAVVNEILRLHPSVPKDVKFAVKPDTLPDGTKIEPGMAVFYLPYAMGRNPKLWEDPLLLKPERWLTVEEGTEENSTHIFKPTRVSDFVFPTFNAGPRLCLGRPLAYVEIMMALLVIMPVMEFTEAREHTDEYTQTIVPSLKHGLEVKISSR